MVIWLRRKNVKGYQLVQNASSNTQPVNMMKAGAAPTFQMQQIRLHPKSQRCRGREFTVQWRSNREMYKRLLRQGAAVGSRLKLDHPSVGIEFQKSTKWCPDLCCYWSSIQCYLHHWEARTILGGWQCNKSPSLVNYASGEWNNGVQEG